MKNKWGWFKTFKHFAERSLDLCSSEIVANGVLIKQLLIMFCRGFQAVQQLADEEILFLHFLSEKTFSAIPSIDCSTNHRPNEVIIQRNMDTIEEEEGEYQCEEKRERVNVFHYPTEQERRDHPNKSIMLNVISRWLSTARTSTRYIKIKVLFCLCLLLTCPCSCLLTW